MEVFEKSVLVPVSPEVAFAWHERPGAFGRLTPPWEPVRLLEHRGGLRDGARVVVEVGLLGPLRIRPAYRHLDYVAGERFVDEQVSGPFRHWRHEHRFEQTEDGERCRLTDRIEYRSPPGASGIVRRRLQRMFAHRHRIFAADMELERAAPLEQPQTVLLTGGTGLIGSALRGRLTTRGHRVKVLSRKPHGSDEYRWDPMSGEMDDEALEGVDAVIHLAGANIAQRWTERNRRIILESRVRSTKLLVDKLLAREPFSLPRILSASGINFYGAERAGQVDEGGDSGNGFLAEVCQVWEAGWQPLRDAGATVIPVRTGIVLDPRGGALAKLLTPFSLGLGGPIGRGARMMSWIGLEDTVEIYRELLEQQAADGPVNAVAPNPVTNQEFTSVLGRVLNRPAIFPVPPLALRAALGQMAEETILGDLRVRPLKLLERGFRFRAPHLEDALRAALGRQG